MTARITRAVALRVLRQLRHDPRTVALLVLVPTLLVTLLRFLFDRRPGQFDAVGAPLVGLFPLVSMFLVTSITVLRERTTGTLERLLTTPMAKADLLGGYGIAFALAATLQAVVVSAVAFGLLGLDTAGSPLAVGALAVGNAVLGTALGLFVSAFATTEFQAIQFMPAFVLPQLLLCGLFVPRAAMAPALRTASDVLPVTYAYDSLHRIAADGTLGGRGALDLAVMGAATVLAVILGAATLRRRTA
ncbi:ABC transporter permease subunit [Baekduia soli]|uniref:Transport permease protein n=1 Tax=Baekduia soli TaxID=496014 RepID=A0A5B8U7B8_9ACTN|nr:ABC transporter permease [Baekduia soli]QEC48837.1 ABC transporter permease subunit [Baekduia soli]